MKKKIIVALLACTMISLTACGDTKENTTENKTEESTVSEETPETTTAASVDDSFYTTDVDFSTDTEPEVANSVIETDAIAIGEYKGIEIEKVEVAAVTDEEVQAEFDAYMASFSEEVEVTDRDTLENGDIADINYVGKINGEEFEGGSAERYPLKIGSNTFIPGFEEQLKGVSAGEDKDVVVTFPEEYHSEDLAGKEAVYFNPGSVGQPRDYDPKAAYAIIKENEIELKRVEYDIDRIAFEMQKAGFLERVSSCLYGGMKIGEDKK